jgi:outer membrane protein assembly factor BamB
MKKEKEEKGVRTLFWENGYLPTQAPWHRKKGPDTFFFWVSDVGCWTFSFTCRTCRLLAILALMLFASAGGRAADNDWPRFRGPNGQGISDATTVPVQWTDKDYNWKVALPGTGHSSPVVWGDRIFLTCADAQTAKRMVLCLAAADGRTLWQRDYPSKTYGQNEENNYASATPAADADAVYLTWTAPEEVVLLALDHAGTEKWRRRLGPYPTRHGSGTSPIVYQDLVILSNDQEGTRFVSSEGKSFIVAVDRTSGETRWQSDRRTVLAAYSTPCVFRADGGPPELIFTSTAHGITAIDPATGKVNWEIDRIFLDRCVASPVLAPGLVIASYGYGNRGTRLVAVRPGSKAKGVEPQVAWDMKKDVPLIPTPIIKDGRLFCWADDGTVTCLTVETGRPVWQERLGTQFFASPVCVNNRLYGISKKGEVFVIAAADKFELLARVPLGEPTNATPAVAGGVMYLRTASHLMSLGGKKM